MGYREHDHPNQALAASFAESLRRRHRQETISQIQRVRVPSCACQYADARGEPTVLPGVVFTSNRTATPLGGYVGGFCLWKVHHRSFVTIDGDIPLSINGAAHRHAETTYASDPRNSDPNGPTDAAPSFIGPLAAPAITTVYFPASMRYVGPIKYRIPQMLRNRIPDRSDLPGVARRFLATPSVGSALYIYSSSRVAAKAVCRPTGRPPSIAQRAFSDFRTDGGFAFYRLRIESQSGVIPESIGPGRPGRIISAFAILRKVGILRLALAPRGNPNRRPSALYHLPI